VVKHGFAINTAYKQKALQIALENFLNKEDKI
jgi:hypothetical protein